MAPPRKETKAERLAREMAESRHQAKLVKMHETQQAISEGMKLIKKDKFENVYDKQPHKAGRVFIAGNIPLS